MKYRLFTLLALSEVLFSSCVKENFPAEGGSILAVMENDDTRTSVTDEGVFTWSEGDKVWLHTTSEGVVGTLSSGAGIASANFSYGSYFGEMTDRAVYPYNEGHSISGDVLSVVMPASYDLGSALTNTRKSLKLMPAVTLGGTIGGDIEGGESGENPEPEPELPILPEPQSIDYIDEYGINHGKGVWVCETFGAPVNCGYHATDYQYDKLYQWGRKHGQGYDELDATVPEFVEGPVSLAIGQSKDNADKCYYNRNNSRDWLATQDDNLWNSGTEDNPIKTEYDPCPEGWRVPTYTELKVLSMNCSFEDKNAIGQFGLWYYIIFRNR